MTGKEDRIEIHEIRSVDAFPEWITPDTLTGLLHQWLTPYQDTLEDIRRGIDDAFSNHNGSANSGFVLVAARGTTPMGALVMLPTGMSGYVPENLLLFVAVSPAARGNGLGSRLINHAVDACDGTVKLHVEYDNPAKRLYEQLGFENKYAEMRLTK